MPLRGSEQQELDVDYRRPLFEEAPDLHLPPYMLVVSFGLVEIGEAVPLKIGDVLIRNLLALP